MSFYFILIFVDHVESTVLAQCYRKLRDHVVAVTRYGSIISAIATVHSWRTGMR